MVEENDEARYSSSAVDTTVFLLQYGAFWKNIDWPIASEAYGYMCIVMEVSTFTISSAIIRYSACYN